MNSWEPDVTPHPPRPPQVFVVDGEEVIRRGLGDLLEYEGCEVVGGSGSAVEAISDIAHLRPDVVILDSPLSDGTGLEVCRTIRSIDPGIRCLMLASFDDEYAVRSAVLAGASGYLLKESGTDRLVREVRRAAAGETLLAPGTIKQTRDRLSRMLSQHQPAVFTPLEGQVAARIIAGQSNREIGTSLGLSDPVVAHLVSSVLAALDV